MQTLTRAAHVSTDSSRALSQASPVFMDREAPQGAGLLWFTYISFSAPKAKNNKTLKIANFNRRETVATHLQQITGKIHLGRTFKANVTK